MTTTPTTQQPPTARSRTQTPRPDLEKPQFFLSGLLFGLGVGLFIGAVGIPMWFSL